MTLLVKRGLADQIFDLVRDRIISGMMVGDMPIRQDALAAELGVSKIPLREAFAKLEQDGLVLSQANRGFFVRPLSADEAYDVFDLRLKIEPEAVALACRRATVNDHEIAQTALAALNQAIETRGPEAGALNRAFHLALIRPGGRLVTMQMVERLQVIAERYVCKHLEPKGRDDQAVAEHKALFGAWALGRADAAAELASAHIANTLRDLRTEFAVARERPDDSPVPVLGRS
ncbi:GntR family transcriptional regulator [Lichenihabitans psoromatis]|uniref:GntR family transcriptional regulator n=1 Tax=Lichenihabitans psoromatis TaxID=2528642 RepID=UPI0010383108|nr:GntR family transcriptional regulator [Lichenihabitans psoromatis]